MYEATSGAASSDEYSMRRRKAWHGNPPSTPAEARRVLLDAAGACVERLGRKAGLTDVAAEAGVTRQTVYRYFDDTDDLFRSAAALASGGFLERLRASVRRYDTFEDRVVQCLVFTIREMGSDPHLGALTPAQDQFTMGYVLDLGFVQDEATLLADGALDMSRADLDELAEFMLRLLYSFLTDRGPERDEQALRLTLTRWLVPVLEAFRSRAG